MIVTQTFRIELDESDGRYTRKLTNSKTGDHLMFDAVENTVTVTLVEGNDRSTIPARRFLIWPEAALLL